MSQQQAPHPPSDVQGFVRHDWTDAQIRAIHGLPLPELIYRAQGVHRRFHDPTKMQMAALLSIKTGGCSEDCGYCPQSVHHDTGVEAEKLMELADVVARASAAKAAGASRFCMGAAWRQVRDGSRFERVLEMVRSVKALQMEVCCTLGMLTEGQAQRLAEAGLTAYNHNLDTGPDYYKHIIGTRRYDDRLATLDNVQKAGIELCCGGILGMGETLTDRVGMLGVLARRPEHPESVPINALVPIQGTPLADRPPLGPFELVRMVATTRIVLPRSRVRLSAGRTSMSPEAQALCFLAGANSIFAGNKLLTTPNPQEHDDMRLLESLGMSTLASSKIPSKATSTTRSTSTDAA